MAGLLPPSFVTAQLPSRVSISSILLNYLILFYLQPRFVLHLHPFPVQILSDCRLTSD
jgi:hypothetical protein